ncbi:ABC transporter permease [Microvirga sp. BT350]|uniref:Transport permease protein n=1 Tax=Microvirga alba TaxID=2791025 RepID=A0A931BW02_9HYPH|nr:ABC transporter permease [Microvirga alba]
MLDKPAPVLALIHRRRPLSCSAGYLTQVYAVADAEIQKLRHDPSELLTRALQPAIWLLLFGQVMAQVRGIAGDGRYLDFLAPGILAQSVLFAAIFYGIAAIWERDLGVLHRYMVSPAPRSALVLGKAASSAVRGLAQAIIVYGLAVILGIDVTFAPANIAGVAIFIAIGSALFSTFSLIIACIVKTRERFMGIGQVLTMPIFFASNAIYPIDLMPGWLKAISYANPLTYEVDGLRALMLTNGASQYGLSFDLTILVAVTVLLVAVAARMYPHMTT